MSDTARFELSPAFINLVLDNYVGTPSKTFTNTEIYVGLGIEFDEESFSFTKEPVSKGFTILEDPCVFNDPINGIIRNKNSIEWEKATEDWTTGTDTIKYVGLYYRRVTNELDSSDYEYTLIAVLPLVPEETVITDEKVVLNPNAIQIKLSNR